MSLKKPKQTESAQVRDMLSEETILFNFNIPKELHKQLKIKSVELDTTMTALIIAGIEDILSRK